MKRTIYLILLSVLLSAALCPAWAAPFKKLDKVPLAEQWFVLGSVEHARNRSNVPNFRYRNTSVSASVVRTF